jgi:hypothetical protein
MLDWLVYSRLVAMSMKSIRRIMRRFLLGAGTVVALCLSISNSSAQVSNIEVRLLPESNRIAIEVNGTPASSWSFLDSYAGIVGLGRRIERFAAFDEKETEVSVTEAAPGQFKSSSPAKRIRYEVNLRPVSPMGDFLHLSWMDKERGVLMPLDFIPLETAGAGTSGTRRIHFRLTSSWAVQSNEMKVA